MPFADIEETDDAWVIEAELPGVDRKDVNVELRDSELIISGEIKEKERKGVLRRRRADVPASSSTASRFPAKPTRRRSRRTCTTACSRCACPSRKGATAAHRGQGGLSWSPRLRQRRLSGRSRWRRSGQALVRELSFRDFDEAMAFVERVAEVGGGSPAPPRHLHPRLQPRAVDGRKPTARRNHACRAASRGQGR